jgi:hypothetical protein
MSSTNATKVHHLRFDHLKRVVQRLPGTLQTKGIAPLQSDRTVVVLYACLGTLLALLLSWLSCAAEPSTSQSDPATSLAKSSNFGVGPSRRVILKLSALFALDAFGGGLVVQSAESRPRSGPNRSQDAMFQPPDDQIRTASWTLSQQLRNSRVTLSYS